MYVRYREVAIATTNDSENIQQIDDLYILCLEHDLNDILNIGETGLF